MGDSHNRPPLDEGEYDKELHRKVEEKFFPNNTRLTKKKKAKSGKSGSQMPDDFIKKEFGDTPFF